MRGAFLAVLLLAAAAAAGPAPGDGKDLGGDIPFLRGWEAGCREQEFSGRPMLLYHASEKSLPCTRLAASVLRDPAVLRLAARFVPVLLAGDRPGPGIEVLPTAVFLDPKGEEAGRVAGEVPRDEFLAAIQAALDRIGFVPVKKDARTVEAAAEVLARALAAKDWRTVLEKARVIEKVGHEGPALEAARGARAAAVEESKKRLAEAAALLKDGKDGEARLLLARIVRQFEGLDAAVEAASLLRLLDAAPDGGGDDGSGDEDRPRNRNGGRASGGSGGSGGRGGKRR